MKKILVVLVIANMHLLGSEEGISDYWNKAVSQTDILWNKTKEVSSQTYEGAKDLTISGYDKSKGFLLKGKKIALEKTLLASMNVGLNNKTITVENLSIDDINGTLSLQIKLEGENHPLLLKVNYFDWDVVKEKENKFIVLEKLETDLDIPWIDYLVKEYLKKHNGYIKVEYSLGKEVFLRSLKEKVTTSYIEGANKNELSQSQILKIEEVKAILASTETPLVEIWNKIYNPQYIKAKNIVKTDIGLEIEFSLDGDQDSFGIEIKDFNWATANDKHLIVLGNITFKDCTKPWISSLLEKHHKQIIFEYNEILNDILVHLKPKTQGNIEEAVK